MLKNHWRAADQLADRLGLGRVVRVNIEQTFKRWDGKGDPGVVKGAQILVASRLVTLADVALVVIGQRWLTVTTTHGTRLLDQLDDSVRTELGDTATGLAARLTASAPSSCATAVPTRPVRPKDGSICPVAGRVTCR